MVRELLLIAWRYKLTQADERLKEFSRRLYFISVTSSDSLVSDAFGCDKCKGLGVRPLQYWDRYVYLYGPYYERYGD